MTPSMQRLLESWNGLGVVCSYHRATSAWIFIALHDDTLGTPVGGTRMKVYERPEDGLLDATRLAEGMTYKWVVTGLDSGGGKAVLALSRPIDAAERKALLERYGQLLNTLKGAFGTGEDLGTTPDDMLELSRTTRYVHGAEPGAREAADPGPYTAQGVLAGILAALGHLSSPASLEGRSVLIQGVGDVGAPLAQLCARAGAELILSDLEEVRATNLATALNGRVVAPDDVYDTPCDVYAPCAVGATLNQETIPRLACRVVAGSANNQLKEEADAERLHRRGILYAPDYVINAGAAMAFGLIARGEVDEEVLERRVASLGDTLTDVFKEATEAGESPLRAARRRVERVLAAEKTKHATRGKGAETR